MIVIAMMSNILVLAYREAHEKMIFVLVMIILFKVFAILDTRIK